MLKAFLSFIFVAWSLLLYPTTAHATIALKNSKGTMSGGGEFTFPIEWDPVRQASISMHLSPEFGIFLFEGFELLFQTHLKTSIFNDRLKFGTRGSLWHWGVGSKILYQFKVEWPVIPFVGFGLNYEMAKFDITTAGMVIDIPAGILVPLNEHVALTVGVSSQVVLIGQLKIFDKLRFEPGCLGIKAFF